MSDDAATRSPRPARGRDAEGRIDLKCLTRDELVRFCADELGETGTAGLRIYKAMWQHGARSVAELHNVGRDLRRRLERVAYVSWLEPDMVLRSDDGAVKYLWRLRDGRTVESVLIPDGDRVTLCMSSQVGCAMACTFCLTGDLGLLRHLDPAEIAGQPLQVQRDLGDSMRITNLVLMGMGEPLHNLDNLCVALENCLDDHALNFSHRRVTVSTVGLVPKMHELAERLPVNLAVSLNATTEAQRVDMMPITRKYSLEALIQACRDLKLPPGKRITFEYVMFRDINDSLDDAARLYALLRDVKAKVNLIPYNENPDRDLRRPSDEAVKAFQHYFVSRGLNCTVRTTRGVDISAACGQLGKASEQAREAGWRSTPPGATA